MMTRRNFATWTTLGLLLCGCGGAGGGDSNIEVRLLSVDILDLVLIVAPRQGEATATDVCSDDQAGFGCTRRFETDRTTITFGTDAAAATLPYYVYVDNRASSSRTATLEIDVDGVNRFRRTVTIDGNFTRRLARIFRDDATDS